jgi:protein gp37
MNKTGIEYLDFTWNPVVGCTPVSAGCDNCWRIRISKQFGLPYDPGEVTMYPERLDEPLRHKKPARIGVCFMGDLFHEDLSFEEINKVFVQMVKRAYHHTYLVLTKRPHRLLEFEQWVRSKPSYNDWFGDSVPIIPSNIHLGVSVEDQQTADERIPILLQIPAAVRWVSVEPMLGGIDLEPLLWERMNIDPRGKFTKQLIKWVVVGCESGAKRRPCNPIWIEGIVKQCIQSGTPVFVKQAEINGKVVKMPEILGKVWDQLPEVK